MLNSKLLLGICLLSFLINSCASQKHKKLNKPCDCPENNLIPKNRKHSGLIFHFKDVINFKNSKYYLA
jgi:hypothetical protein